MRLWRRKEGVMSCCKLGGRKVLSMAGCKLEVPPYRLLDWIVRDVCLVVPRLVGQCCRILLLE